MTQIVCNELAEITWRSPADDIFMFRLNHLRELSEGWRQEYPDMLKPETDQPSDRTEEVSTNKFGISTRSKSGLKNDSRSEVKKAVGRSPKRTVKKTEYVSPTASGDENDDNTEEMDVADESTKDTNDG